VLATLKNLQVELWDPSTGRELAGLARPENHEWPLNAFAMAPDGNTAAAADSKGHLYLWDVPSRSLRTSLQYGDDKHAVYALAFSPDSSAVAGIADDRPRLPQGEIAEVRIVFWNAVTGARQADLVAPSLRPGGLAWSPDGKTLATAMEGSVLLWDVSRLPHKP
jgi:hypothetical protein